MPQVRVPAGTIEYADSGPPPSGGPTVVLLHGLFMDGTVWRKVVPGLRGECRVIQPTLPLGAHRVPMDAGADLGMRGMARLVADFLDALDLRDVVLVLNDWGGPLLLTEEGRDERIGRFVFAACELFDNFPPGIPGRLAALAGRLGPRGVRVGVEPLRFHRLRRFPLLFGWMSKRPVPAEVMDGWFAPILRDGAIRRDLAKYAGSRFTREEMAVATERLRDFDRPALVVWAPEDKLMPAGHGRRLAALLPHGRLVEIDDSYTLIPEDRPEALTDCLLDFVRATADASAAT